MQRNAPFICRLACRSINVDPLIVKTAQVKFSSPNTTITAKKKTKWQSKKEIFLKFKSSSIRKEMREKKEVNLKKKPQFSTRKIEQCTKIFALLKKLQQNQL